MRETAGQTVKERQKVRQKDWEAEEGKDKECRNETCKEKQTHRD